jgi:hypothetical protein
MNRHYLDSNIVQNFNVFLCGECVLYLVYEIVTYPKVIKVFYIIGLLKIHYCSRFDL